MPQLAIEERQWLNKALSLFVGLRSGERGQTRGEDGNVTRYFWGLGVLRG